MTIQITPLFRWYDLWIGLFFDLTNKRIYFFPIPMFGIKFDWSENEKK